MKLDILFTLSKEKCHYNYIKHVEMKIKSIQTLNCYINKVVKKISQEHLEKFIEKLSWK